MLIEPQRSKQQGRDVTTYLVSPRGVGGSLHCSIQQAIDKAEPYSRIVVQGGVYYESINITVPVEIVGDDGILPEIVCRGVGITVSVDIECYLENIKVTSKGAPVVNTQSTLIRGTNASVRIVSGMPTFFQCELTSVFVGGTAKPTIANCTITGSLFGPGIAIAEYASGTFKNNVISNHIPYCLAVSSKGSPIIEQNEVSQNARQISNIVHGTGAVGIAAHMGVVLVTRDGRDITRNVQPEFINNTFRDETQPEHREHTSPTCFARRHALAERFATAVDYGTHRCCVRVDPSCTPVFKENVMSGGAIGILLKTGAGGNFEDNNVHGAHEFGVVLCHESFPTLRINTISKCMTGMLAEGTAALLIHNTVRDNDGAGMLLLVGPKDDFRLEGNSFVANDTGIVVMPSARKKVTDEALALWLERQHRLHGRNTSELESRAVSGMDATTGPQPQDGDADDDDGAALPEDGQEADEDGEDNEKHEMDDSRPMADGSFAIGAAKKAGPGQAKGTAIADLGKYSVIVGHSVMSHNRVCGIAFIRPTFSVLLTDVDITQNGQVGALVSQGACPVFRGVRLDRGPVGIRVERSGRPIVKRCTLMNHSDAAIYVTERGAGKYFRNILVGFTHAGILIDDGSVPEIYENAIRQSGGTGVMVEKGGIGTIRNNKLHSVAVGIGVTGYADPIVHENLIENCNEMGIFVRDDGIGTFIHNTIERCHIGAGVSAMGEPTIRDNRFDRCVCVGIILSAGSRAVIEKNRIEQCLLGGIMMEGRNSKSHVVKNVIKKCGGFGIRSTTGAEGLVLQNHLSENMDGALSSADEGMTRFERNTVTNESGPGIKILEKGGGLFINNTISSGSHYGVELMPGADATIERCTIALNAKGGVALHPKSSGCIKDCWIRKNGNCGIVLPMESCVSRTDLRNLIVEENGEVGIRLQHRESSATFHSVTIRNHSIGIDLVSAGRAVFEKCIAEQNGIAVQVTARGMSRFQECTFRDNSRCDVSVFNDGDAQFAACSFVGSSIGFHSHRDGRGEVVLCTFEGQSVAATVTSSGAHPVFTKNTFTACHVAFLGALGAAADFLGNQVTHCYGGASLVALSSDASRIKSNTVTKGLGHGMVIEAGSKTVAENNTLSGNGRSALVLTLSVPDYASALEALRRDEASYRVKTIVPDAAEPGLFAPISASKDAENDASRPKSREKDQHDADKAPLLPEAPPLDRPALQQMVASLGGLSPEAVSGYLRNTSTAASILSSMGAGVKLGKSQVAPTTSSGKGGTNSSKAQAPSAKKSAIARAEGDAHRSPKIRAAAPTIPNVDDLHRGSIISSNLITDAAETGIVVCPLVAEGRFVMLRNTIQRCVRSGAVIGAAAKPLFAAENVFKENQNAGLHASEFSAPEVHESHFIANSPCNIKLADSSVGRYCTNLIEAGEPHGVIAMRTGAYLLGNRFIGHGAAGHAILVLSSAPKLTFEENTLEDNNAAIVCEGTATFMNNRIQGSAGVGLRIVGGASPSVSLNTFSDCTLGVELDYDAGGSLVGNTFWKCHEGAAAIGDGITTRIEKNQFEGNQIGLVLRQNDTLFVEGNCFIENVVAGVNADDGSRTKIHNNEFRGGKVGVLSTGTSMPRVFRNRLAGCATGVHIRPSSGAKIEKCFFDRCEIGVLCQSGESTTIAALNSIFSSCSVAGWCSEGAGAPDKVGRCLFMRCKDTPTSCGILLRDGGGGMFMDNDIHLNSIGVLSTTDAVGEVSRSFIHDNISSGVVATTRGSTSVIGCTMFNHRVADVVAGPYTSLNVRKCMLKSRSRGIVLGVESSGTFAGNTIKDAYIGVFAAGCGGASVSSNLILGCNVGVFLGPWFTMASIANNHVTNCGHGVYCSPAAAGDVTGNLILTCDVGIVVDANAATSISHCGVTKCQKAGIAVRGKGNATVSYTRVFENTGATGVVVIGANATLPASTPAVKLPPLVTDSAAAPLQADPSGAPLSPASDAALTTEVSLTTTDALGTAVPSAPISGAPLPKHVGEVDSAMLPATSVIAISPDATHTITDCDVYQNLTNVMLHSGAVLLRRCSLHDGELGLVIQADMSASIEANSVFDNARAGVRLSSRNCTFAGNDFFSKDAQSALEIPPPDMQGYQLSKDNNVLNQCAGRAPPVHSRAPLKASDLSQSVPTRGRGDPTAALQVTLCTVHRDELPDFIPCGCTAIPNSGDRNGNVTVTYALDFNPASGLKSPGPPPTLDEDVAGAAAAGLTMAPPLALAPAALTPAAPAAAPSKAPSPRKPSQAKPTPKPPGGKAAAAAPRRGG